MARHFSSVDKFILNADQALKTLIPNAASAARKSPADEKDESPLSDKEKKHVAGLMRINHTGEVCGQALYQGQAL
ncbi:MAG: demethoxyubiquinone hydroxylase family protein, partial [Spongiibacteraceae bacterium]|nr:demethoxyubiquinone hydroxylase family protein [Spongiibacteraceae bacterium]